MADSRLITTSNFLSEKQIAKAVVNSKNIGFKKVYHKKNTQSYYNRWAGTPKERLKQFEQAINDSIDCIHAGIGGSGVIHFLEEVNFSPLLKKPKFIVGSSDLTPLLNYTYQQTKVISLHGPNAYKKIDDVSQQYLKTALEGKNYSIQFSNYSNPPQVKKIKGIIQGGNLAMCAWSLGSKFKVNLKNRIVFFEDIGTNDSTAYNRIVQLKISNTLQPKAIIFGYLMKVKNMNRFIDAIQKLFPETPIIYGMKIGHKLPNITIPIGGRTTINFEKKEIKFDISHSTKKYKVNFDE